MRVGAPSDTLFMVSDSGWMNKEIYLEWFRHFIQRIPPTRPVLLIQDGHSSHISIELIELAREILFIYCAFQPTPLIFSSHWM
jgi:hypothetical protein